MKALILCAGKGTRLRPLTKDLPKSMITIKNRPILEYLILLLKKHGIQEIAVNTSYLPEKIKEYFKDGSEFGVKIKYSYEDSLLGTAGALNNFKEFFNEPFFVIYGDNLTDLDLTKMQQKYKESKAFGAIYLYHEKMGDSKTTPGQVLIDKDNFVIKINENPNENEKEEFATISDKFKFTNAGIYIFNPEIFDFIGPGKSDFAKQILPEVLKKRLKIYGHTQECYIREIGQIKRYLKAKEEVESEKIKLNYIKND